MEALGGGDAESQFQEELAYMADKFYHMSVAELLKKVPEDALRDQVFRNRAVKLLQTYGERLMEE